MNETEKEKAELWLKKHSKKCLEIRPPARHLDVSGGLVGLAAIVLVAYFLGLGS